MGTREVMTRHSEGPDAVLRYADHRDGLVDVFLPASLGRPDSPAPLLVLLHGGFWRQAYDRMHVRPLANALVLHGFAVAVPEYRRVGGEGGWPETGADVAAALAAAPGLIEEVAPGRIDPTAAVVVSGHSAGGHLAMWAGLRAGRARVRSVVALAPVADLRYAARAGLGANATQALLGGEPADVPDRYHDADPIQLLDGGVRVTIIQGTEDEQVPAEMNRLVAARSTNVSYLELEGIDHFALIDPLSPVFMDTLLPALRV